MQRTADALMGVIKEKPPLRSNMSYFIKFLSKGTLGALNLPLTASARCMGAWKKNSPAQ